MLLKRYDTAFIWRYKTSYNIFVSFSNNFWTKKKFFSLYLLWMAYFVKLEKLSGIRLSFRFSALLHFHKTNSFPLSFLSLIHTHTHTHAHKSCGNISPEKGESKSVLNFNKYTCFGLLVLYRITIYISFRKSLLQFLRKEW